MLRSIKNGGKIQVVMCQILATLPSIVPAISQPENFKAYAQSMGWVNLNIITIIPFGCWVRIGDGVRDTSGRLDYYNLALATALLPIGVVGLLVAVGWRRGGETRVACFTAGLGILYLVLPTMSTTIFGVFPCDEITDNEDYLRADYSSSCKGELSGWMVAFGSVCLLLYPVGIPLAFARLLWGSKYRTWPRGTPTRTCR